MPGGDYVDHRVHGRVRPLVARQPVPRFYAESGGVPRKLRGAKEDWSPMAQRADPRATALKKLLD
jgi:hypothetical protein